MDFSFFSQINYLLSEPNYGSHISDNVCLVETPYTLIIYLSNLPLAHLLKWFFGSKQRSLRAFALKIVDKYQSQNSENCLTLLLTMKGRRENERR